MERTVIKIDENICNGCGICVTGCHEGAIQLINNKAVMVSDLYCDGLGACIGDCPVGAIELIKKETEPYNEIAVMERISKKGPGIIEAHLKHLKDHGEDKWFNQGVNWCKENGIEIDFNKISVEKPKMACGCPGSMERDFRTVVHSPSFKEESASPKQSSQLRQWPVQLHLLNPMASFFQGADVLLASDCSAFTVGDFHDTFLKNKTLAIACPKLDSNTQSYEDKLVLMMDQAKINTLTILIMEVPCCGGLVQIAKEARKKSKRNVPVKVIIITVQGEVKSEEWID